MNIAHLLLRAARARPNTIAIKRGTTSVASYAKFAQRSGSIARWLTETVNLKPGDRVGLAMTNCVEFLEVLFGCWLAGLVAVPINAKLHPREIEYILENSGAKICFTTDDLLNGLSGIMSDLPLCERLILANSAEYSKIFQEDPLGIVSRRAEDPAWLFYTSGTTGRPKGATLTNTD